MSLGQDEYPSEAKPRQTPGLMHVFTDYPLWVDDTYVNNFANLRRIWATEASHGIITDDDESRM
jgi:hypothetical protein